MRATSVSDHTGRSRGKFATLVLRAQVLSVDEREVWESRRAAWARGAGIGIQLRTKVIHVVDAHVQAAWQHRIRLAHAAVRHLAVAKRGVGNRWPEERA